MVERDKKRDKKKINTKKLVKTCLIEFAMVLFAIFMFGPIFLAFTMSIQPPHVVFSFPPKILPEGYTFKITFKRLRWYHLGG